MTSLDIVSLKAGDREVILGSSRSGKSTLERVQITLFHRQYCVVPYKSLKLGRILILDTKPRFRVTRTLRGSPRSRYRGWKPGTVETTIDGMALDDMRDWSMVWDQSFNPTRTVVVQQTNDKESEQAVITRCIMAVKKFSDTQSYQTPSLVVFDEGMDFMGPTGMGPYSQIIGHLVRKAGERNLTVIIVVQRPKNINTLVLTESNVFALFYLRNYTDKDKLADMGLGGVRNPPMNHSFWFIRNNIRYPKRLMLPPPSEWESAGIA